MTSDEIKRGEGKNLEFKEKLSSKDKESFLRTVVAFANGSGGKIVFGVNDSREIIGIPGDEIYHLMDQITNLINDRCSPKIVPEIYIENIEGKQILVVEVFPSPEKPYYLLKNNKCEGVYVRIGATTRKADEETIRDLQRQKLNISFDEEILYDVEFSVDDFSELRKDFRKFTGKNLESKDLYNLKLLKNVRGKDYLTVGGALLVGRNDLFEYAKISCARFSGVSRASKELIDQKEFTGPLYRQVEESEKFLMTHLEKIGKIKGFRRYDEYVIPLEVLREATLNAVVHRDYSMKGSDIKIFIFDDRLEIVSPGGLPGNLTVELIMKGRSEIRNRVVARFFKEMGYIEQWGTGIVRILELCREKGLKTPKFEDDGSFFTVVIYKAVGKTAGEVPETAGEVPETAGEMPEELLDEDKKQILDYLKEKGKIKRKDIEEILNLKERRARSILKEMVDDGLLERRGSGTNTYYVRKLSRDT
ncbi:MAG: ATP-dependent DNA helicase [Thermotogaceae bacterium]|nr:ATP-dependent DNA helicase [Thermotogaceae bacterium]